MICISHVFKGDDVKYKDAFLADTGIKQSYFEELNVERTPGNLVKSYIKGITINMFRNYSATMKSKIESIANDFDVIIAEHYEVMQYIPKSYKEK